MGSRHLTRVTRGSRPNHERNARAAISIQTDSARRTAPRFSRDDRVRFPPVVPAAPRIVPRVRIVTRDRTDVSANRLVTSSVQVSSKHCRAASAALSLLQTGWPSPGSFCEFVGVTSREAADLWSRIKTDLDTFFLARRLHSASSREWPATRPTSRQRQMEWSNRQPKGTKPC